MESTGNPALDRRRLAPLEDRIRLLIAGELAIEPAAIDLRERLNHYGLDSLQAGKVLAALAADTARPLPTTLLWEYPTVEALSRYLAGAAVTALPSLAGSGLTNEPIAVVGIACRFPGADGPRAFWRLLCDGVDAVTEAPADRETSEHWGGFLADPGLFDAAFFGISPREASQADPQQRLVLELAWEVLEDTGVAAARLRGQPTAVLIDAMGSDYARLAHGNLDLIAQHTATGQDTSLIANRISYTLGLEGPSLTVNTACSSSLVAVHLACQSLHQGECRVALAGGANLILAPDLNLRQVNSEVRLDSLPALLPDTLIPWPAGEGPRLAAVSSFGASGTNAHVIVEEGQPDAPAATSPNRPWHLLTASAVSADESLIAGDVQVFDADGAAVAEALGLTLKRVAAPSPTPKRSADTPELASWERERPADLSVRETINPPVLFGALAQLAAAPPGSRHRLMLGFVRREAARVLDIGLDQLDARKPLMDLGLDSLMAVELRNSLVDALHRPLPTTVLFDYPTVQALTDFLTAELFPAGQGPPPSVAAGAELSLEELEGLSPDGLLARLRQVLE